MRGLGLFEILVDTKDIPEPAAEPSTLRSIAEQWRADAITLEEQADAIRRAWARLAISYTTSHTGAVMSRLLGLAETLDAAANACKQSAWAIDAWANDGDHALDVGEGLTTAINHLRSDAKASVLPWWTDPVKVGRNAGLKLRIFALRVHISQDNQRCEAALAAIGSVAGRDPSFHTDKDGVTTKSLDGWSLFGAFGKPNALQVNQGGLGDCWFMSSLAALAQANPQAIMDMVRDNGDGTYTVMLFFPDEWQAVVVDADFPVGSDGRPLFAGKDDYCDALWPLLVEKAAAQLAGGYENLENLHPMLAMTVLTGQVPAVDYDSSSWVGLAIDQVDTDRPMETLTQRVNSGEIAMVVSSRQGGADTKPYPVGDDMVSFEHCYWVESMTDNGDGTGTITIIDQRDPLRVDYRLTLTWDEYKDGFDGATFVSTS